jgi:SHS family lactate transporter-like MFS transporter
MSVAVTSPPVLPWWREPTKDQWYAFIAAWLGWTLDGFDFTVFLFLIVPIAKTFNADLTLVVLVGSLTLWMRLIGAVAAGWMSDRWGRRLPLMISILWYSICNFIAGFSPTFMFLLVFRTLLGIGMGAEWPTGAALMAESWPARSRGTMSCILQSSFSLGYLVAGLVYAYAFDYVGWRGMLFMGILPALAVVWIRFYVKEPRIWAENHRRQKARHAEVKVPLLRLFRADMRVNTLTAIWWLISSNCIYYSLFTLVPTWLAKDLHMPASQVGWPLVLGNGVMFLASFFWGTLADKIGRRWSVIIPAIIGAAIAPVYLLSKDYTTILAAFGLQGAFAASVLGIGPAYANERFPTEIRATASAFCYHVGVVVAGFIPTVLTYFAVQKGMGFAMPMLVATLVSLTSFVFALLCGPETKGKELGGDTTFALAPAED